MPQRGQVPGWPERTSGSIGQAQSCGGSVSLRGGLDSGVCAPGTADPIRGSSGAAIRNKQARRFIASAVNVGELQFLIIANSRHRIAASADTGMERNGV